MKVKVPKTYSLRENTRMFHQTVKTVEKTRQAAYSTSKRTEQQFWCDSWSDIQHRHFIITISVTMSWSTCPAIFFTLPMKVSSTQRPGRLIQAQMWADLNPTNTVDSHTRNNRHFRIPTGQTVHYKTLVPRWSGTTLTMMQFMPAQRPP